MQYLYPNGLQSVILRVKIRDATSILDAGLTGLTSSSAGLIISTICDNEATPTVYTQAGGTIETVTTLGTYAAPTATKCRFKLVDNTNHPGLYELHFADARFAVGSAKELHITITGPAALNIVQEDYTVQLAAVPANLVQILGTALTETAGQIAAAFKKFFNIATPAATMDHGILVDTVTTYTGNTPQTGDVFPLASTEIADIIAAVVVLQADLDDLQARLPAALEAGRMAAALPDVDGVAFSAFMEAILAVLFGEAVPVGSTVEFKKRDGTTTRVTITYGAAPGERTASVLA